MERATRFLKIGRYEIGSYEKGNYQVEVKTLGNFSRVLLPSLPNQLVQTGKISSLRPAFLSEFLLDLFFEFENQFDLRILNWEVLEDGLIILIHHEPKEKAEVAQLLESEPVIVTRLLGV